MLLVDKLKISLTGDSISPTLVHFLLAFSVAIYTLFGALVMQYLESPSNPIQSTTISPKNTLQKREIYPFTATRVFLGPEITDFDPKVSKCLEREIKRIFAKTNCFNLEHISILPIDLCYQLANYTAGLSLDQKPIQTTKMPPKRKTKQQLMSDEIDEIYAKWSFENAVIFAFTVITTIGYGHVAPITFWGRLFCIIYGVIGVPLTLLTIADMGMFISMILQKTTQFFHSLRKIIRKIFKKKRKKTSLHSTPRIEVDRLKEEKLIDEKEILNGEEIQVEDQDLIDQEEEPQEEAIQQRRTDESILLCIIFFLYLMFGAKVLSSYEPDMHFFEAFYFNFVTLTTIGLGDFVPKSYDYLFITLCYIGIGLALTTMSIEIAADALKKLHHFGRKVENVASTMVWFGGKKMTMKALVKHLGDQLNIPQEEMDKFNFDQFVGNAIKVEAGEMKTLRKDSVLGSESGKEGMEEEMGLMDRSLSYTQLTPDHPNERSLRYGRDGVPLADETGRSINSERKKPSSNGHLGTTEDQFSFRGNNLMPHLPRLSLHPSIQSYSSNSSYDEDFNLSPLKSHQHHLSS